MMKLPLTVAFAHFSSCSGCQLMLLNCEAELPDLGEMIDCAEFCLAASATAERQIVDLALVEGSVSSPGELERLLELRRRSRYLVAVGSCALTGGVNHFETPERPAALQFVYADRSTDLDVFQPQPIRNFVAVDWSIPGCPPERRDFLELFGALRCGGWPVRRQAPVCMECRIRENRCLLEEDGDVCLGPVTRSGCNARCPSILVPCEGCRGEVAEANRDELYHLLLETGLKGLDIRLRMQRFAGGGSDQADD